MPSVISGDANVSATEFGFLDGVTSSLQTQINSKLNLAGGKILQIVRATDSTDRSTTSTSYVDVPGMSVTITPQKSDSALLIMAVFLSQINNNSAAMFGQCRITDSSNNAISGAETANVGSNQLQVVSGQLASFLTSTVLIGRSTPATTSAVTYKLRFQSSVGATFFVVNGVMTGQMYAIEVSA